MLLGIRNVGETTARDLAAYFGTLDRLIGADVEILGRVPDIGPVVAQSIADFFSEPHNLEIIEQLRASGVGWKENEGEAMRQAQSVRQAPAAVKSGVKFSS